MVNNVVRAITAALDWSSSSDARQAAYSYLESVRLEEEKIKILSLYI